MSSTSGRQQLLPQYSLHTGLHCSTTSSLCDLETDAALLAFYCKSNNKWKHRVCLKNLHRGDIHDTRDKSVSRLLHSISLPISIISTYANLLWVTFQRKVSTFNGREGVRHQGRTHKHMLHLVDSALHNLLWLAQSTFNRRFQCHNFLIQKKKIS